MTRSTATTKCLFTICFFAIVETSVCADTVFVDGFDDNDLTNDEPVSELEGSPIIWRPFGATDVDVESGKLIVLGNEFQGFQFGGVGTANWGAPQLTLNDISMRTRVRLLEGESVFLNPVRDPGAGTGNYFGVIGDGFARLARAGNLDILEERETDLNVSQEDLIIQIDSIGEELSLWAWRPEENMPDEPLLSYFEPVPANDRGDVWVGVIGPDSMAEFDYVHVATTHISGNEPTEAQLGDFDADGLITVIDIDALMTAMKIAEPEGKFDLNDDGSVNGGDLVAWVKEVKGTWLGDANLDGEFNSTDFVMVFAAGEYEDAVPLNSGWAEGDWDGDGEFNSADFVAVFKDGGYEKGPRIAAHAVPEPASTFVGLSGVVSIGIIARRRRNAFSLQPATAK